jgi:hypothetical protein
MKSKLIIVSVFASILTMSALFALSSNVQAHEGWGHGGGHYVYRPNYGWVVPAVVGGAIVYGATRPNTVIVQQPIYPPPTIPYWQQPADYHWESILDANCNCYRTVLVHN